MAQEGVCTWEDKSMIVRGMVDVSWVMETADISHIPVLLLIYPNILPLHMPCFEKKIFSGGYVS